MLIYNDGGSNLFGGVGYKSVSARKRSAIQAKTTKRSTRPKTKVKRAKKSKKSKKLRNLNTENIKFLRTLGLRVKKV